MSPIIIDSVKYDNKFDDDRLLSSLESSPSSSSLSSIETIIQIDENSMKSCQPKNYKIQSNININNNHHRKYSNSHYYYHHHHRKHYHHCWYMLPTRLLFFTKLSTLFLLLISSIIISCSTITITNTTILNHNANDINHRHNNNNDNDNDNDNDNNSNIIHHSFSSKNNLTSLDMELIFESIFNERNYQDAIEKMTRIWKLYNSNASLNSSTQMISSSQKVYQKQQIVPKYDLNVLKNRSRRWTSPNTTQSDHQSSNDQMIAEDSTVYNQDLNNDNDNNKMRKQKNGIIDRNSETEEKANIIKLNISCLRCSRDERERSLRIEAIKMNILSKLNMEHPPNVSLKDLPKIPPVNLMLNKLNSMYNDDAGFIQEMPKYISKIVGNDYFGPLKQFDQDDEDEFFVHTSKSVVFAQKPPTDRIIDDGLRVQYFKFPANILNNNVAKAYLWLYVKGWSNIKTNLFVALYQVVRGSTPLEKFKTKRLTNSVIRKGGWISIRVEKLVSRWMNNPEDNLGLVIHAYDSQGQQISVIHNDDVQADSALRPYIELLVDNQPSQSSMNNNHSTMANSRPKRTIGLNCEDKSSEVRCCRYPLTVDFEQFGWDWIIAPKRYQANYCSGECPFVLMNQYPHTHLIQQIHMNAIGPCCSPRKMSSISMLYMDADYNVIYGIVPNMVVDRCGCS